MAQMSGLIIRLVASTYLCIEWENGGLYKTDYFNRQSSIILTNETLSEL